MQIGTVSNFCELINTPFENAVNALCWEREIKGDFEEIVSKLQIKENITEVTAEDLMSLQLSENGAIARDLVLNDLKSLAESGTLPSLNLIKNYERDDDELISTDVYSYHVDSSPVATDTFLCTYFGAPSDIIPNDQAVQKILIPEIIGKLQDLYDPSQQDFSTFVQDYHFDLHYQANADAQPINLGLGHLWKLAVKHPGQKVLPCIHRAPKENTGEYRLLLIC